MPDPRWTAPRGVADALAPGAAPAWGAFDRAPGAGVTIREASARIDGMRVLGSEPVAPGAAFRRNSKNAGVYVTDARRRVAARATVRVPVVGEIAAGRYDATVAYHDYLEYEHGVEVDRALVRDGSGVFALRVRGTSMTHVGIDPGDLVVIHPQDHADNGDFVVARLTDSDDPEGYVTLKRFYRKQDHIFLQSATAAQEPIRLYPNARSRGADRDRVKVQGRVIVVIKSS
ncbi:MAG TPA: S24 family peptidase [Chloroflexia bacterium]|jgi:SOS-response transcriptional repressor LexA|nr:S24 family peptidase [Chloroflexia bacterium]